MYSLYCVRSFVRLYYNLIAYVVRVALCFVVAVVSKRNTLYYERKISVVYGHQPLLESTGTIHPTVNTRSINQTINQGLITGQSVIMDVLNSLLSTQTTQSLMVRKFSIRKSRSSVTCVTFTILFCLK
jgi:hypothetical protein